MSLWSKIGALATALPTGGASLVAESKAGNSWDPRGIWNDQYAGHEDDPGAAWASRPDPYAGMPAAPTDVTSGVNLDRSGLDAYSKEALRTGPSAWSGLAHQQNDQNEMDAFNRGMGQAASRGQEAKDSMAMTGGLTSGAAERSANATSRGMLDVGQDVHRQADSNALQIDINDEQNRMSELSALPGMQLQAGGFDLSKAQAQNQFNAQNYNTQGSIWAAGKQADAQDPRNPASPNFDDGKRWYNPFTW